MTIRTRASTKEYRDNWGRVFRRKAAKDDGSEAKAKEEREARYAKLRKIADGWRRDR